MEKDHPPPSSCSGLGCFSASGLLACALKALQIEQISRKSQRGSTSSSTWKTCFLLSLLLSPSFIPALLSPFSLLCSRFRFYWWLFFPWCRLIDDPGGEQPTSDPETLRLPVRGLRLFTECWKATSGCRQSSFVRTRYRTLKAAFKSFSNRLTS